MFFAGFLGVVTGVVVSRNLLIAPPYAVTIYLIVFALLLAVLVLSLFISVTPLSHPPALALTIFSFIAHDTLAFTETSLVVLALVAALAILIGHVRPRGTASGGSEPSVP